MSHRSRVLMPLLVSLLALGAWAGCGGKAASSPPGSQPAVEASAPSDESLKEDQVSIVEAESRTPEEKSAAREALRHAEDANAGSFFKAIEIKVEGAWARVAVEEGGVPEEEAVGFSVFLRRQDDGAWEVADTGNSVSPDQLSGAPPELFEAD